MKYVLKFTILFILLVSLVKQQGKASGHPPGGDTISLLDAKTKGGLLLSIRGAYHPNKIQTDVPNAHYGKCIDLRMKNISDSVLDLVLESGTILLSRDSSTQDMLVTKTTYYSLKPNQRLADRIFAMCGELHKNAPDVYISYDVGSAAEAPAVRLAKVIEKTGQQGQAGQYAVWAVTDGATRKDLGDDYAVLETSQALLQKANIDFDIFGDKKAVASVPANIAKIIAPPAHQHASSGKVNSVQIDTALLAVETTPVSKASSKEGIHLGSDSSYLSESDSEGLLICTAGVVLLLLSLYFFKKDRKKAGRPNDESHIA